MNEFPPNDAFPEPAAIQSEDKGMRPLIWGGTAVALLFLAVVVVAVWLDPFGWALLSRLTGRANVTLTAVPQDSIVYVSANLFADNLLELQSLRETFTPPESEMGSELDDYLEQFKEELAAEYDIVFAEDVQPWLGHNVGFALLDISFGEYGAVEDVSWLLLAEASDREAANAFLAKVADAWAEENVATPATETYGEVTITSFAAEWPDTGLALAQSGRLVLVGNSAGALKQAIDTQAGESLGDKADFQDAMAELPQQRFVTLYANGTKFAALSEEVMGRLGTMTTTSTPGTPGATSEGALGTAVSLSFVDAGLQFDSVTLFDLEELPDYQQKMLSSYGTAPTSVTLFPENTILYGGLKGLENVAENYDDLLAAQTTDPEITEAYEEMMDELTQMLGVDLETDFFPYLGNEIAFGLIPSNSGMLAEEMQFNFGAIMLMGVTQEAEMLETVADFAANITDPRTGIYRPTEPREQDGFTLYEFYVPHSETAQFACGVGQEFLLVGTSSADLLGLQFEGGTSLADNPRYQNAMATLPQNMTPYMYLDIAGMMDIIGDTYTAMNGDTADEFEEQTAFIRPLQTVAMAISATDASTHQTVILVIEE